MGSHEGGCGGPEKASHEVELAGANVNFAAAQTLDALTLAVTAPACSGNRSTLRTLVMDIIPTPPTPTECREENMSFGCLGSRAGPTSKVGDK